MYSKEDPIANLVRLGKLRTVYYYCPPESPKPENLFESVTTQNGDLDINIIQSFLL
jgi:hypothetical protein